MQNKDGVQKGPQDHAEGGHGAKTRGKILEQLHSGSGATPRKPNGNGTDQEGAHRLLEERKQHDTAEKESEKTRLSRELDRRRIGP